MSTIEEFLKTKENIILSDLAIHDRFGYKEDYFYRNIYHFLKENGTFYHTQKLTKDENNFIKMILDFKPIEQGCYFNSHRLIISDKSNQIKYIEGVVLDIGTSILHGWNTLNGKLIDLTLKSDEKNPLVYFGCELSKEDVIDYINKTGKSGSVLENYEHKHPLLKKKYKNT